MLQHTKEPFAYVDFDDERLEGIQNNQLNDILEVLYKIYGDFHYIFLDEIQNVEGWPLFVNRLLLANRQTKCKNLLLLTDHEYQETEKDGITITIKPVYEWACQISLNK